MVRMVPRVAAVRGPASRKGNAANRSTSRPTAERDAVAQGTVARAITAAIAARGITVQPQRMRGTLVVASSAPSEA